MGAAHSMQFGRLLPRLRTPTVLHKLKRTLGQRLRRWRSKRQKTVMTAPLMKTANGRSSTRLGLLRPMPRCSSFGSRLMLTPTVQPPTQQEQQQKLQTQLQLQLKMAKPRPMIVTTTTLTSGSKRRSKQHEAHYAEWKSLFEQSASVQRQRARVHNISEALAGQTTPRGFPSHTDKRRCAHSPSAGDCKVRRRLSLRLPKVTITTSAHVQRQQLASEAQLQQELKDLNDYYGGFYYM